MKKNIVIIGAGPIGCFTAQLLKIYGYDPLLIEEHSEIGRPLHCTGLVGNKVFTEKRPFMIKSSSVINTINGAIIHYGTEHFSIERKKVAFVIDRERFDKELSKGLNILYQNKFLGFEKHKNGYIIETDKDQLFADILIGADGANSTMRKMLNRDVDESNYYKGVQLRMKMKPLRRDFVEVYLRQPSFFWIVPEAEEIVRVGTISANPYRDLQIFLKEENLKGEVLEKFGGFVAVGICQNTVKENIALVGDAASQTKPLSYGGVYFGLKAAHILASCIKDDCLCEYDSIWKKALSQEIRIGLKIRDIYNQLDRNEVGKIFRLLKKHKVLIEKIGDFESHGRIILEIIKRPTFYPQAGDLFRIFLRRMF